MSDASTYMWDSKTWQLSSVELVVFPVFCAFLCVILWLLKIHWMSWVWQVVHRQYGKPPHVNHDEILKYFMCVHCICTKYMCAYIIITHVCVLNKPTHFKDNGYKATVLRMCVLEIIKSAYQIFKTVTKHTTLKVWLQRTPASKHLITPMTTMSLNAIVLNNHMCIKDTMFLVNS